MGADQLLKQNAAGKLSFGKTQISPAELNGTILRQIDLSEPCLTISASAGVNLSGAGISGVKLSGISLLEAKLTIATLCGADLVRQTCEVLRYTG